ncbi:type I-B CRISPR-associated protein Cas7/Cst2/DevR [Methanococcus voltae]|uniref:CRISPR-associated protein Cst2 n=1 Tax=Methanococcus voltae TaxID=2188 RepID=A0A8J7RHY2_METVO|nr:type I-B CRISPR-associated protein Cas7/Cst2/DevR [Methanococcus voltae]MBP2173203.1 CRISPR-associated protein Cst2 [Methanococcus voltae]MBP2201221.1 CRISPR-associated protein Cst2 [Methanococcus voltae]
MKFNNIAGTFVIDASASFLNGAGLKPGEEDKTKVAVKTMKDGKYTIPYVSTQSWKRWLRNTAVEENEWKKSEIKGIDVNEKGNTNKVAGELDPIICPEDDIFGYMSAKSKETQNKEKEDAKRIGIPKVRAVIRKSPFVATVLKSIKKSRILTDDNAFVHIRNGSPVPYTTQFYNTCLEGLFCIECNRIGVFDNRGDRVELDDIKAYEYEQEGLIEVVDVEDESKGWKRYQLVNLEEQRKERISGILKSLSVLRGGAKQAAFGTDVAPKVIIMAPMQSANPIFNNLFECDDKNNLILKIDVLKEILSDYTDRITGKVYIGLRKGYVANEKEIYALKEIEQDMDLEFEIASPIEVVNKFNENEF